MTPEKITMKIFRVRISRCSSTYQAVWACGERKSENHADNMDETPSKEALHNLHCVCEHSLTVSVHVTSMTPHCFWFLDPKNLLGNMS